MKFKIGDRVEVINYGHVIWMNKSMWETMLAIAGKPKSEKPSYLIKEEDDIYYYDVSPQVVGKIGVIDGASTSGYSLNGIPEKHAWYSSDQLKISE